MSRALEPVLLELRRELERAGMVVVPHGDHICVRLPMFASVRARVEGGELRLSPQLGPFKRAHGILLTILAATGAGVGGFLTMGTEPAAFAVAFAALSAMLVDVSRLLLTENAMTRLHLAWSLTSKARVQADNAGLAAGASAVPALGAPPSHLERPETARADRA